MVEYNNIHIKKGLNKSKNTKLDNLQSNEISFQTHIQTYLNSGKSDPLKIEINEDSGKSAYNFIRYEFTITPLENNKNILMLSNIEIGKSSCYASSIIGTMWHYISKDIDKKEGLKIVGHQRVGNNFNREVIYDLENNIILQDAYLGDKYDDFADDWFSNCVLYDFQNDPPLSDYGN